MLTRMGLWVVRQLRSLVTSKTLLAAVAVTTLDATVVTICEIMYNVGVITIRLSKKH